MLGRPLRRTNWKLRRSIRPVHSPFSLPYCRPSGVPFSVLPQGKVLEEVYLVTKYIRTTNTLQKNNAKRVGRTNSRGGLVRYGNGNGLYGTVTVTVTVKYGTVPLTVPYR